jgi:hypothetical protein
LCSIQAVQQWSATTFSEDDIVRLAHIRLTEFCAPELCAPEYNGILELTCKPSE